MTWHKSTVALSLNLNLYSIQDPPNNSDSDVFKLIKDYE